MRAEESRPGADTETAITNRADSMVDSTAYAPPEHAFGDADEVTRIIRELADAKQKADRREPAVAAARAAGRLAGERLARTPLTPRQRAMVAAVMGGDR